MLVFGQIIKSNHQIKRLEHPYGGGGEHHQAGGGGEEGAAGVHLSRQPGGAARRGGGDGVAGEAGLAPPQAPRQGEAGTHLFAHRMKLFYTLTSIFQHSNTLRLFPY